VSRGTWLASLASRYAATGRLATGPSPGRRCISKTMAMDRKQFLACLAATAIIAVVPFPVPGSFVMDGQVLHLYEPIRIENSDGFIISNCHFYCHFDEPVFAIIGSPNGLISNCVIEYVSVEGKGLTVVGGIFLGFGCMGI